MSPASTELNRLPETGSGGQFTTHHVPPYRLGDRATLHCEMGFKTPVDAASTVILTLGQLIWDPHRIDCEPISELNALPETNAAGTFSCSRQPPYHYEDRAVLSCENGYLLPSTYISTVVVENGRLVWKPPEIHCNPVQCLPPYIPEHASVSDRSFYFPKSFRYVCHEGYKLNQTLNEFWCSPSGDWNPRISPNVHCDPIRCPQLKDPANGTVLLRDTSFGAVAIYKCNRNFIMLQGEKKRVCQGDGTWSGEEVVCGKVECSPMPDIVKVQYTSNEFNIVDCGNGESVIVKCLSNGQWQYLYPYCDRVENTFTSNILPKMVPNASKADDPPSGQESVQKSFSQEPDPAPKTLNTDTPQMAASNPTFSSKPHDPAPRTLNTDPPKIAASNPTFSSKPHTPAPKTLITDPPLITTSKSTFSSQPHDPIFNLKNNRFPIFEILLVLSLCLSILIYWNHKRKQVRNLSHVL